MIYFTSDLHFNHNKDFIWQARGFNSVEEMNETIISNWNNLVTPEDDIYILGDVMLGELRAGLALIQRLNGKIHIIRGNHDTPTRLDAYYDLPNIVSVSEGEFLDYKKYHFYLTHFPCVTSNGERSLKECSINLSGHTHSTEKFFHFPSNPAQDNIYDMLSEMDLLELDEEINLDSGLVTTYNVRVDAHNCTPVSIEEIISDLKEKWNADHLDRPDQLCL